MMTGLVKWYERRTLAVQLVIAALSTSIPFYFSAFLAVWVADLANLKQPMLLGLNAAVFIVLFTAIIFFARYAAAVKEKLNQERRKRVELRLHAYTKIDRLVSEDLERIKERGLSKDLWGSLGICLQSIQRIVDLAYLSFEAAYGQSISSENRTDFEVTFMTKSYTDGEITIPACANRDARAPRSMILRRSDPQIYNKTVTATLYQEERPAMHIIEDTRDQESNYSELYSGQTERIRSSIVYPVLSNGLLGALVVHCDRPKFFEKGDEKYWSDLLEVFSKRIALVKKRLDLLFEIRKSTENLMVTLPELPF